MIPEMMRTIMTHKTTRALKIPKLWRVTRPQTADIILSVLAITLGVVMLTGFGLISDSGMRVLLAPHAKITGAFYHMTLPYLNGVGYVALEKDFVIGPDCLGVRFIVMMFCMMVCIFTRRFRGIHKIIFFALSFVCSITIGLLASCVRILGSVPLVSFRQFTTLHAGAGAVIYLFTIVGIYILVDKVTGGIYENYNHENYKSQ